MELELLALTSLHYQPASKDHWTGRPTKPELGSQYWYQQVEFFNWQEQQIKGIRQRKPEVALLGYACDEGVSRNLGRPGAQHGPAALRQRLGQLPFHLGQAKLGDFGDVTCPDQDMEASQNTLTTLVRELISEGIFPIVIGGGHDMAYGHFKGIWQALQPMAGQKIGILNFDAHFDLRPVEHVPNSGTPFNQLLHEFGSSVDYMAIGIQELSNTSELFAIAQEKGVGYILNYDCELANFAAVIDQLAPFVARNDYLYITIDLDGFSSAYAPGVSAPSPMGFTPYFVQKTLRYLLNSRKVVSCDLAELNPTFDRDNATANLAARLVADIVAMR